MEERDIKNILVKHYAGSHAYGTNTETSDIDIRGIFCADPIQVRTPFYRVKEQKIEGEDTSFYELANYCKLAAENNPNILETLWVDWSDVMEVTPAYGKLRENRHLFMSSKLAFTTTGYATAQLKRIKSREKHASFLPDLNRLCELLLFCFEEGTINREWVINHCGEKVFNYFLEKYDINESDTIGEVEGSLLSVSHLVRYTNCEDLTYEALNVICKPKQTEFIKMVQNLMDEKVLKFDFYSWHQGYQLVPFGNDIFGIYQKEQKRTFTDTFEIIQFFGHDKREDYPKEDLLFIVKFNEKQYKEAQHSYKMFWNWYENRNETRLEMEKEFGFDCYSDDTEFLTEDGWKSFDEVGNLKLATFDDNHMVQYQFPIERIDNLYTGNLYHFTGQHQDTLVTANHRMYVKDYARNIKKDVSDWKFSEACLVKKDHKVLRTINPKKNIQKLPNGCYNGDLELKHYLMIMGWYISDGSMTFNKCGLPKNLSITQSKPQSILTKNINKLRNIGKIKCSHSTHKRKNKKLKENTWVFPKDVSCDIFNDCGHGSKNKRLPNWVFYLTKRLMTFLLKSALHGDGSKRGQDGVYIYHSSNYNLAGDIQRLAFCCGYKSSLWGPYKGGSEDIGECNMYQVHINTKPNSDFDINSKNNVSIVPVKNKRVVCFSVKNGTLITRRNGKISLHGNCKHAMHLVRLMRIGEEVLTTGQYNVKRADADELLSIRNGAWTFEQTIEYANYMDDLIINKLYKETKLQKSPDVHGIANLLMEVQDMIWN